jgi:hypothetical protein
VSVATTTDGQPEGRDQYLAAVQREIDEEVRKRRASGDLPARLERELDELFLQYSPLSGRDGDLSEVLRMVDAAAFIDPVVPVASDRSGGTAVKKTLRSLSLWYMGFVTHQVSQFTTAASRALHSLDEQLRELRDQLDTQRVPPAPVVVSRWHGPDAWWVERAVASLSDVRERVLHTAAGDGWLVRSLVARGIDGYGVDPRADLGAAASSDLDLRSEDLLRHLRAVEPSGLGAVVLSGVVDAMTAGERERLLDALWDRLTPDGRLVVHSLSPSGWASPDAPLEADLATGRPLRASSWAALFERCGCEVEVAEGPEGADYVVTATRQGR